MWPENQHVAHIGREESEMNSGLAPKSETTERKSKLNFKAETLKTKLIKPKILKIKIILNFLGLWLSLTYLNSGFMVW